MKVFPFLFAWGKWTHSRKDLAIKGLDPEGFSLPRVARTRGIYEYDENDPFGKEWFIVRIGCRQQWAWIDQDTNEVRCHANLKSGTYPLYKTTDGETHATTTPTHRLVVVTKKYERPLVNPYTHSYYRIVPNSRLAILRRALSEIFSKLLPNR